MYNYIEVQLYIVFYATTTIYFFQFPRERELVLALELPVISVDDWIEVHDVLTGKVVGSVRAVFAVGKESQIFNFLERNHVTFFTLRLAPSVKQLPKPEDGQLSLPIIFISSVPKTRKVFIIKNDV